MTSRSGRTSRPGRLALAVLAGLLVALFVGLPAGPAQAAEEDEWEIRSFDAVIVVDEDGSIHVTETIAVTFHIPSRGIIREIPYLVPVDNDTMRRYRFDRIEVQTSPGAPDDLDQETSGDFLVWRIGDPDVYITGDHTYTLSYRVQGALNRFDSHDELFWNVTGDRWRVPIQQAIATVQAPGITEVTCFAGATGETDPCASADHDGRTATFTAAELPSRSQLDVVVGVPPGLVDVAVPELVPADRLQRLLRSDLPRVFTVDAVRAGAGAGIGLLGLTMVFRLARRGARMAGRARQEGLVGEALPGGVEYRPPDGLRPAQLRLLLDQKVDKVSLSATLVDLAVRGHLRIEELPRRWGRQDWMIHHQVPASTDGLQEYEQTVLTGLFSRRQAVAKQALRKVLGESATPTIATGVAVTVSSLKDGSFHSHYVRARKQLNEAAVHHGFFPKPADALRSGLRLLSLLLLAGGIAGIVASVQQEWTYGLVFAPLVVTGLLLAVIGGWASMRTPAGEVMRARAEGFREFIRTAEADRMDFAEREKIFVDCLPYAMVFGCVDRWVKAFERIGVPASTAAGSWYVGQGTLDVGRMTSSMSSLSAQVGTGMSRSASRTSSGGGSSGFSGGSSGGGGGGGGGGRW